LNKDGALFPSQFVNIRLLVTTQHNVTLIPTSGVQRNAQGPFVYLIQDQKATLRTVKVGTTDGNITAVEGINPGDVVAVNGFDKLQDGVPVRIQKPGASGGANANSGGGGGETP
jgi:multidrug efflux system membrane fusion protein